MHCVSTCCHIWLHILGGLNCCQEFRRGMVLLGSSNPTQDSPMGLASILIIPSCTLPSRKTNSLLDSGDRFCRKEEKD